MRVMFLQRVLPHYRISFFDKLNTLLFDKGIELVVVYGQEAEGQVPRSVLFDRSWAIRIKNKYIRMFGHELVWQAVGSHLAGADLIIIEQANRLLVNYRLQLFSRSKVAFWGHGKNFQSSNYRTIRERWKRWLAVKCDWWFTYTQGGSNIVRSSGFDEKKITVVNNSIDTSDLTLVQAEISSELLSKLKAKLGLIGNNIGIYCGGMYPEKKIPFLLKACAEIRSKISDFEVLFVGDGPSSDLVEKFCQSQDWAHYLGEITGNDRVPLFSLSGVLLMPGAVGLAVLDSFALRVPMATTNIPIHGPEFDYLVNGYNCIISEYSVQAYSDSVANIFQNRNLRSQLVAGCIESSQLYSADEMAQNFCGGILMALDLS